MRNVLSMPRKYHAALTAFDYLYRDAGNFKSHGSIILIGDLSVDDMRKITDAMEDGDRFIAEQVSIPALYSELFKWSGGRISSDHVWHSFEGFREVSPDEDDNLVIWGRKENFVSAFVRVKSWKILMSPNADSGNLTRFFSSFK